MNPKLPNHLAISRIPTPLGDMTIAATDRGVSGAWFDDQKHRPADITALSRGVASGTAGSHIDTLLSWFEGYWQHGQSDIVVAMDPQGTAFQRKVWGALLRIAPGATTTYGNIARDVGTPKGSRAVGAAVGRNPLGILVPCHRVVGQDGSLTGYAGGLPRKRFLLALEAKACPSAHHHQGLF